MIRPALICFGLFIVSWAVLMGCVSPCGVECEKARFQYERAAERFE